ncbi:MAG: Glu-tRNA(Gln) amidotransferase subunit GatE [Candidatus Thalassarchaeaceae archaeon]|nr:Glu-tRNA(Gln) amidotransferase subunit GatE [Candidatus Thalassarchaeaceae archaeon]
MSADPMSVTPIPAYSTMEPTGNTSEPDALNPVVLGFMCGLEVHQQLATDKLHSRMPSELYDFKLEDIPKDWNRSNRKLRASEGEGGKIDVAARFEQMRNRAFEYVQTPNSGLIELDEAPPRKHDASAVEASLMVAAMMDAKPIPNLQAMRKTVVDGSNTSGFQRTTLIATRGRIDTDSGEVGIDLISLEEDSARKLGTIASDYGETVFYTLDRLGVPLVEVATAPDVKSPEHAKQTAIALGRLLRDTRQVRRGLGSIRQDLNVSIACGDRVEIKGCQDLDWIPGIIRLEMARQLHFYRLANELRKEASLPPLPPDRADDSIPSENRVALAASSRISLVVHDLTEVFGDCESAMVRNSLDQGATVHGVGLAGFSGKIGIKAEDANGAQLPRLGRELASAAKLAGVAGIFHSDELPDYGISTEEVDSVRSRLSLNESDAFALCVAPAWQAELALESVVNRVRLAFHRIPREVRNVVIRKGQPDDGTTTAMRPLPGEARMYPETDIPLLEITSEHWDAIRGNLPPTTAERKARLQGHDLSSNQIEALLNGELDDLLFEGMEGELNLPGKAWASALLEYGTRNVGALAVAIHLREIGAMTREGIETLVEAAETEDIQSLMRWMSEEAISRGFTPADSGAVEAAVDAAIDESTDLVRDRGMGAVGPLMGIVMQKLGGSADGKTVSEVLREKIREITETE